MTARVLNKGKHGEPEGAVYIGRPTKWGNPYAIGHKGMTRAQVIAAYETYLRSKPALMAAAKAELKGKDLVCWCSPLACHGDILLKIANEE